MSLTMTTRLDGPASRPYPDPNSSGTTSTGTEVPSSNDPEPYERDDEDDACSQRHARQQLDIRKRLNSGGDEDSNHHEGHRLPNGCAP
ncbi:hypothetical protein [Clavibacter zhangzhiyongii]|uniref:Uncharacterized protein n=1 Tax=Clavibacter zhangzhiyongii TaxID=2768071 RepID=A0A7L7YYX4_9MICO|nr:hypothetical protein [Clavibacter zhangzhiyongii]QOD42639.1 hypothetical protein H9X71_08255 [Clavibacter zhangzhiyongii]